jgi:hypothetical protein
MADSHFTPVTSVSYRETELQRQHAQAGRTGNALRYSPDTDDSVEDAADFDNDVEDAGDDDA